MPGCDGVFEVTSVELKTYDDDVEDDVEDDDDEDNEDEDGDEDD